MLTLGKFERPFWRARNLDSFLLIESLFFYWKHAKLIPNNVNRFNLCQTKKVKREQEKYIINMKRKYMGMYAWCGVLSLAIKMTTPVLNK